MRSARWALSAAVLGLALACGEGAPFGMVQMGSLNLEGDVDGDYLARQLQQLEPRFQACYARTLRTDRKAEGAIRWRIKGGAGELHPEVTANETANDSLASCATSSIASLRVVEPAGAKPWDFTIEWSVNFAIARPK